VDNNAVIVKIVTSGRTGKERLISDANKKKRRMSHKKKMKHRRTNDDASIQDEIE